MTILRLTAAAGAALVAVPAAALAEPRLTEPKAALAASLKCTQGVVHAKRTPLMLVTGTGASGDEAYAIGKGAFAHQGVPVCWVNFPNHTTADIQRSVQYLVHGLRAMHRRAGRKLTVFGISQGGLLPRVALTHWPSLRRFVDDVIAAAGAQRGTTVADFTGCGKDGKQCVPARRGSAGSRPPCAPTRTPRASTRRARTPSSTAPTRSPSSATTTS